MSRCPHEELFPQLAVRTLAPVLTDFDLLVGSVEAHRVTFSSERVWVAVNYQPRDCEIFVTFGRPQREENLSYTLYLRAVAPAVARAIGDGIVESASDVDRLLGILAGSLTQAGRKILEGDEASFDAASELRWWHFRPESVKPDKV